MLAHRTRPCLRIQPQPPSKKKQAGHGFSPVSLAIFFFGKKQAGDGFSSVSLAVWFDKKEEGDDFSAVSLAVCFGSNKKGTGSVQTHSPFFGSKKHAGDGFSSGSLAVRFGKKQKGDAGMTSLASLDFSYGKNVEGAVLVGQAACVVPTASRKIT